MVGPNDNGGKVKIQIASAALWVSDEARMQ
jgi:hypothetical protein